MEIPHFKATVATTDDGSKTLLHNEFADSYHSLSGAKEESLHVYIFTGLNFVVEGGLNHVSIFEMGFGSGLNCLLSLDYSIKHNISINYTAIELYPLELAVVEMMEFDKIVDRATLDIFRKIISLDWGVSCKVCDNFTITKIYGDIQSAEIPLGVDVVYYDAFAYDTQPQLWSSDIFSKLYNSMNCGGVLTTYSSKGKVKEALRSAGFTVKRLQGVGKKRHIIRAYISEI